VPARALQDELQGGAVCSSKAAQLLPVVLCLHAPVMSVQPSELRHSAVGILVQGRLRLL
jgi:hypothetical protein